MTRYVYYLSFVFTRKDESTGFAAAMISYGKPLKNMEIADWQKIESHIAPDYDAMDVTIITPVQLREEEWDL